MCGGGEGEVVLEGRADYETCEVGNTAVSCLRCVVVCVCGGGEGEVVLEGRADYETCEVGNTVQSVASGVWWCVCVEGGRGRLCWKVEPIMRQRPMICS